MSIRIVPTELRGSGLVRDYLSGADQATRFFAGSPFELEAYRAQRSRVEPRFGPNEREAVARMLRPTSPGAAERLARFVAQGGAVVTTGQQTGLFTGPLYTIYKILTAVRLAAELEGRLGCIVLPVFWSASEDHDWAEVNHAWIADLRGRVERVSLGAPARVGLSTSEIPVPDSIDNAVDEVAHLLRQQSHAGDYLKLIRGAYRPGVPFASAFLEMVQALFAPFHLLTVDAADPALKQRSLPVLRAALEQNAAAEAAVRSRTGELTDRGYRGQVTVLDGAANVFVEAGGIRQRLHRAREGWRLPDTRTSLGAAELEELLARDPRRISPNVLLRPVVESAVLPVLAYVGGPGEIAYWAQLGHLFRLHGVPMPLVVPRASFLLLRPAIEHMLTTDGLGWADLALPEHRLEQRIAAEGLPAAAVQALAELREATADRYAALMEAGAEIDPTLTGALGASRNAALLEAAQAERKLLGAVKRGEHERLERIMAARAELFPGGELQERVLNVLPFLARYGPELLERLAASIHFAWLADREAAAAPA